MTIGVSWIREGRYGPELWFATDSRLSGDGHVWDDCPKLLPLPRRDAVAAFSGTTEQAYPLLLQTFAAINSYTASRDGTLEFFELVGHLERVANSMMSRLRVDPQVHGSTSTKRPPFATAGDSLIVGGYSRQRNGWAIRALQYEPNSDWWWFTKIRPRRRAGPLAGWTLKMFGDGLAQASYRRRLARRLLSKTGATTGFEPLEVLADLLRCPAALHRPAEHERPKSIGGSPQVVRVQMGATATPLAVRWDSGQGLADYVLGRRTFAYENLDLPRLTFVGGRVSLTAPGQWRPVDERTLAMQRLVESLRRYEGSLAPGPTAA